VAPTTARIQAWPEPTSIDYVPSLKASSNDIAINFKAPQAATCRSA